jgi:hypothetical protein
MRERRIKVLNNEYIIVHYIKIMSCLEIRTQDKMGTYR